MLESELVKMNGLIPFFYGPSIKHELDQHNVGPWLVFAIICTTKHSLLFSQTDYNRHSVICLFILDMICFCA